MSTTDKLIILNKVLGKRWTYDKVNYVLLHLLSLRLWTIAAWASISPISSKTFVRQHFELLDAGSARADQRVENIWRVLGFLQEIWCGENKLPLCFPQAVLHHAESFDSCGRNHLRLLEPYGFRQENIRKGLLFLHCLDLLPPTVAGWTWVAQLFCLGTQCLNTTKTQYGPNFFLRFTPTIILTQVCRWGSLGCDNGYLGPWNYRKPFYISS